MNPSVEQARRYVLVSMIGLLVMAAYKNAKGVSAGDAGLFKRLWGVGVLGLMLSAAADFVPQLAGPFALLVLVGYATEGGDKAIENVLGKVSGDGGGGSGGTLGQAVTTIVNTPPGTQVSQPTHPGQNQ